MNRFLLLIMTTAVLHLPAGGQGLLRTFDLKSSGSISVVSELVIKPNGRHYYSYALLAAEKPGSLTAWDESRGTEIEVRQRGENATIVLPPAPNDKVEHRIRIDEAIPSTGLTLHRELAKGRYVFNLPVGYSLESSSLPAQIRSVDGQISVGIVQGSDARARLSLVMRKSVPQPSAPFKGSFAAQDNRVVSYQLLDPKDHSMRLWLEMYVDKPGQSHFYSQLRKDDHTTDPVTLDVDRGIELPTRIISGKEANAIGDAPTPFPDDALVLVADLGYSIPSGGSARIRSFQTATDPHGYGLVDADDLLLSRFIARTRTQYILPRGWSLDSLDQPGVISSTPDGRVTIDFVSGSAKATNLTILAHRDAATEQP